MNKCMRNNLKKGIAFILCWFLLLPGVSAFASEVVTQEQQAVIISTVSTTIGENSIEYPQLEGMSDTLVQQTINNTIVEKAKIAQRMVTLSMLQSGGEGLTLNYQAYMGGDLFSTVINAVGIMENGRSGQEYTALCFSLSTGKPVTLSELFSDPDAAVAYMEQTLEDTYWDELSAYLVYAALSPLPVDQFTLDENGITFYYPSEQFSLLSGYSGAAQFHFDELSEYWITDPEGYPAKLGALPQALSDAEMKTKIIDAVTNGKLPDIPVTLGMSMLELVSAFRLLRTPDQYPGGRYFQLEAPMFRQVLVLSDALTSTYDNSVAEGIMSFRTDLYGLKTGETKRERWLSVLGDPKSTVVFDEDLAYDYGLPLGTADYYSFGGRQLLLYADENDTLYAIRITRS